MTEIKKPVLGAYPIKEWLDCPNRTRLTVSCPEELRDPYPPATLERMASGIKFEEDVYKLIRKVRRETRARWKFAVIEEDNDRSDEGRARAEKLTLEAMGAGAHVIWNGRLRNDEQVGVPDLLIREDWSKNAPTPYTYLPVDVKEHKVMDGKKSPTPYEVTTLAKPDYAKAEVEYIEGTPKKVDSLQLVHYWYLLNSVGHAGAKIGAIYGKEGFFLWRSLTEKVYNRKADSAFTLYDRALAGTQKEIMHEKERIATGDGTLAPLSGPFWKASCHECPFRTVCYQELTSSKHISLIPGITEPRAKAHTDAGISTYFRLAQLDRPTAELIDAGVDIQDVLARTKGSPGALELSSLADKIPSSVLNILESFKDYDGRTYTTLADLRDTHSATAAYSTKTYRLPDAIDAARVRVANRVHRKRGVDMVPIPRATIEWDVDIEDIPLEDGQNMCYLIGVTETIKYGRDTTTTRFIPFVDWSGDPNRQAVTFRRFWNAMKRAEKKAAKLGGNFLAYVYSAHEFRFFAHLARTYRVKDVPSEKQVNAYFETDAELNPINRGVFIDMYPIIQRDLIWPTDSYSIKDLARFIMFFWRDDEPGGANSVAWARDAIFNPDPKVREAARNRVLEYNEDDVLAMKAVRDWLTRFGTARKPGVKLPGIEVLDLKYNAKRKQL